MRGTQIGDVAASARVLNTRLDVLIECFGLQLLTKRHISVSIFFWQQAILFSAQPAKTS